MSLTSVLVAEPHPIFRWAVRTLLERHGGFAVVEALDFDAVVAATAVTAPELALVDLDLPPRGGTAAVEHLARACGTRALVWSLDLRNDDVAGAIRAGAAGYLDKQIEGEELLFALAAALRGEAPLTRSAATLLVQDLQRGAEGARVLDLADALSDREREVLELAAGGAANRQIGSALRISEFTVKRHMQNILQKLGVGSRREAARFHRRLLAVEEGVLRERAA